MRRPYYLDDQLTYEVQSVSPATLKKPQKAKILGRIMKSPQYPSTDCRLNADKLSGSLLNYRPDICLSIQYSLV